MDGRFSSASCARSASSLWVSAGVVRRADLLELDMPEPDLSVYDRSQGLDDAKPT
jgi:hypothetical protein